MAFGSFKMQEFKEIGDEALSSKIPFNEQTVLENHKSQLSKEIIDLNLIKVISNVSQTDIQNVKNAFEQVLPMKPLVILDFD